MSERPKIHELKTDLEYYEQVRNYEKPFEVRRNDRGFRKNDYLLLRPYCRKTESYHSGHVLVKVISILDDPTYCKEGYITMGIRVLDTD